LEGGPFCPQPAFSRLWPPKRRLRPRLAALQNQTNPLPNICLNKLDRIWAAKCSQLGILVPYANDLAAMCRSASAREALRRMGLVMSRLGLRCIQ